MRSVGVLEHGTAALGHGDHLACVGHGASDLARVATQAFATAPAGDALVLCLDGEVDWDPFTVFADEVRTGRLDIVDNRDAYAVTLAGGNAADQLRGFDDTLETKLAAGFTGMRVVADNTGFLGGSDSDTDRWLAWEQRTDHWQATRPVTGICWFDDRRVSPERLAAAGRVHPASAGGAAPAWRLFHDVPDGSGDAVAHLAGEVDAFDVADLLVALDIESVFAPTTDLDLSAVAYLHHRALLALTGRDITLRNEPRIVRALAAALDGRVVADTICGV